MAGEINIPSRTQIIKVEPYSGTVSVINAGPQGPSGGRWSGPYLWTPSMGVWDFPGGPTIMLEVDDWGDSIRRGRYWTQGLSGQLGLVMFDASIFLDLIISPDSLAYDPIDGSHVSLKLPLPSAQTSLIGIEEIGGDSSDRYSWSDDYWAPTLLSGCQAFSYDEGFAFNESTSDVQNSAQLVSFPVSEDDLEWQEWMRSWTMTNTQEGYNVENMFWSWPYYGEGNSNTAFENLNGGDTISWSGTYLALELP